MRRLDPDPSPRVRVSESVPRRTEDRFARSPVQVSGVELEFPESIGTALEVRVSRSRDSSGGSERSVKGARKEETELVRSGWSGGVREVERSKRVVEGRGSCDGPSGGVDSQWSHSLSPILPVSL